MTLVRYYFVSIGTYIFILVAMYLLVDYCQVDKIISYLTIYAISYVAEYFMTLTFVFRKEHAWIKVAKFILNTGLFLFIGALLFKILLQLQIYYLAATLVAAIILMPLRFVSNKYFVYK